MGHKTFSEWRKALEKMRVHASSNTHIRCVEAEQLVKEGGTIAHQLQCIEDNQRRKNRNAIKSLLHCTHFLCKQHILHRQQYEFWSGGGKNISRGEKCPFCPH